MGGVLGSETGGRCLVMSGGGRAWRALVPPVLVGVPLLVGWALGGGVALLVLAVCFLATGAGRAMLWCHCRDDSLWDDRGHLVWSRGGRVVTASSWADLTRVYLESSRTTPEWSWGRRRGGPALPEVFVNARVRPLGQTFGYPGYRFATLVIIRRADLAAAEAALRQACADHGVSFARV